MADVGTVIMNIVDWSNRNALSGNSGINHEITYKYDRTTITGEYTLPTDITTLGIGALYHFTALTVINMPASLKQIESKALANCTNLSAIHCNATTAPAVANADAFSEVDKSISIFIPDNAESYYSYTHTTGWKEFTNYQVTLPTIQGAASKLINKMLGAVLQNSSQTRHSMKPRPTPRMPSSRLWVHTIPLTTSATLPLTSASA
ncbi:MAG: leucine-rich repeat domain-containing protein [Bacteroidaceae bacterium]|nr:leucine-rich repeat domain-containing protein [Bacteroidaceae bacterium]